MQAIVAGLFVWSLVLTLEVTGWFILGFLTYPGMSLSKRLLLVPVVIIVSILLLLLGMALFVAATRNTLSMTALWLIDVGCAIATLAAMTLAYWHGQDKQYEVLTRIIRDKHPELFSTVNSEIQEHLQHF